MRRILRRRGWIALVSYTFTDRAFTDMLFPKLAALKGMAAREEQARHRTPMQDLFGEAAIHTLRYLQSFTEDWSAFFGGARSGIEAPEGDDPEFEQFEALRAKKVVVRETGEPVGA